MKVSELKNIVFNSLDSFFSEFNYKPSKGKFCFSNNNENAISYLQFTTNNYEMEIDLIPRINVNVKEINKIWSKYDEYISYTYSMNLLELEDWYKFGEVSWDKFQLNNGNRFVILNEYINLQNILEEIKSLFSLYGLRYFNEFGDVEGVDKLYNAEFIEEKNFHCPGFQVRSVVGIISAKLAANPSYYHILEYYTQKINKHKEENTMRKQDIDIYFKIKDYLG